MYKQIVSYQSFGVSDLECDGTKRFFCDHEYVFDGGVGCIHVQMHRTQVNNIYIN